MRPDQAHAATVKAMKKAVATRYVGGELPPWLHADMADGLDALLLQPPDILQGLGLGPDLREEVARLREANAGLLAALGEFLPILEHQFNIMTDPPGLSREQFEQVKQTQAYQAGFARLERARAAIAKAKELNT